MKYYEIDAVKSDDRLIERFFEDGRRFLKKIPFNPKIVVALQEQFKGQPINIELKGGWIVITKMGHSEKYASAAKEVVGDKPITIDFIAEQEMKMLQKAGYKVTMVIGEIE